MDFSQISVIPNVTLSDGTSDGTLTLMNVSPGDTFSLTGSAEATLVIDELVIDSYTMPLSSYPEDTTNPLDFSMLADYLPPSVTLNDVSATLEMNPSDLTGLSLFLNAKYGGADHILFGSGTPASPGLDPLSPTQNIDLQQIVNDAPADLIFEYVVSASNATITSDPANENRFGAVLNAHVGLSFTSNSQDGSNEILINGSPVVERVQDDILGRTGNPDEDDQLTEFLLFAKEVTINMAVTNNTGLGLRAEIVEPAEGDLDEFKLTFDIGPNDSNADMGLTLGNAQIQRIADDTDFRPEVHLYIPDSPSGESYMLRTDANATISAWLGLETDISYEFDLTESGGEE
jgi:hypothetical protein